ncbi:MAG: RHS repeat-associated core domain-containing protein [Chloroflexota bacterium]
MIKRGIRLCLVLALLLSTMGTHAHAEVNAINTQQEEAEQSGVLPHGTVDTRRPNIIKIDSLGRLVQKEAIGLLKAEYSYEQEMLSHITYGTGLNARVTQYDYNADELPFKLVDALDNETVFTYNADKQVTTQQRPDGETVTYIYENGVMTGIIPPGKPAHLFSYNNNGQLESYTAPYVPGGENNVTRYHYDNHSILKRIIYPSGAEVSFQYVDGQFSKMVAKRSDGQSYEYRYNYSPADPEILIKIDGPGETSVIQDVKSARIRGKNVSQLTGLTWVGEVIGKVEFDYNRDNVVEQQSVVNQTPVDFKYNTEGYLTKAGELDLDYEDLRSELLAETTLEEIVNEWSYNEFGEVTEHVASYDGEVLYQASYRRDRLGRIERKTEIISDTETVYDYVYDNVGRLVGVQNTDSTVNRYVYDKNGNRLSGPTEEETGVYDEQDRLIEYAGQRYNYTADGYLQSKGTSKSTTNYQYDVLGNLWQVSLPDDRVIDYIIDGSNRRIGKKVDGELVQGFLYKDELNPIAELDGKNNVISQFIYASYTHVPAYMIKEGKTYRIITDHLGSPRLVVEASSGEIVQRLDYDEFGNVIVDTNPGFQPFGFAGGLYDADTGLVRFGVRDYDPFAGRWTAKDPLRFDGGDTNIYAYLHNDPINYIDPSGFSFWQELIVEAIKGAVIGGVTQGVKCLAFQTFSIGCAIAGAAAGAGTKIVPKIADELVGSISFPNREDTTTAIREPAPVCLEVADLTYEEIQSQYDELKSAQWKVYLDTVVIGTCIRWKGFVGDIDTDSFIIKRSKPNLFGNPLNLLNQVLDKIIIKDVSNETILALRADEEIEFEAIIREINGFQGWIPPGWVPGLEVSLSDVTIVDD